MPCTTILVGKKASADNSTMIARTDDGTLDVKKLIKVLPKDQPRKYKTVISHLEIELPDNPLAYSATPNVDKSRGIWAASGINSKNVAMSATETISTNPRVLGADPMVVYKKAASKKEKDIPGGIGEEDIVVLVLPYISSAREGVIRLGMLLEKYGTYEPNGIAFSDENEIWWLETIGGHHFIAKRVKDEEYVIMPNQFGLDNFDFDDAYGDQKENICSADLKEFMINNHLDLNQDGKPFNPRLAFGSHDDSDHVYNTCRAWYMARYFNPLTFKSEGEGCYTPESDNIPWSFVPDHKITVEEVKYILGSHYQGTPYDPYSNTNSPFKGKYRPIGVNNTDVMSLLQIRDYVDDSIKGIHWLNFSSSAFSTIVPFYSNVDKFPKYVSDISNDYDNNFYWGCRLINVLVDAHFGSSIIYSERYQKMVVSKARAILNEYDKLVNESHDTSLITKANEKIASMLEKETTKTLKLVIDDAANHSKNKFYRGDN